ncbi:hypothetical protein [Piscinibacter sp.]|uniref:hypothetical protein n=1 Tax=Piscinibacter sp. TaxID=1903157 RepID=UPI0035599A18
MPPVRESEVTLNIRLLERTTRRVRLTPAGRELLPSAHAVVRIVDATVDPPIEVVAEGGAIWRSGLTRLRSKVSGVRSCSSVAGSPMRCWASSDALEYGAVLGPEFALAVARAWPHVMRPLAPPGVERDICLDASPSRPLPDTAAAVRPRLIELLRDAGSL